MRLASASTTIKCESPQHLADLVLNLSSFETYSAEREDRSPADAALRSHMNAVTAQDRDLIEQALERLLDLEQLDLDTVAPEPVAQRRLDLRKPTSVCVISLPVANRYSCCSPSAMPAGNLASLAHEAHESTFIH